MRMVMEITRYEWERMAALYSLTSLVHMTSGKRWRCFLEQINGNAVDYGISSLPTRNKNLAFAKPFVTQNLAT